MGALNKVMLIGNLGSDPEIRYTASGQAVANFNLATTEVYTNKDEERQELTEWHRIVAWGRLAEICGEYLSKGRMIYIEGSLRTRSWEDKEGRKRWTTEVFAQSIKMLGPSRQRDEFLPEFDKESSADFKSDEDLPFSDEVSHKETRSPKRRESVGEHRAEKETSKKRDTRVNSSN
ncbi:MAG TPA: single-stranded DNA-binding protein [Thermodesulfobacteriota bacterium]|nr:single-stranded DNA-binding protein [Thermodesulfobacteriota bacterium]